MIEQLNLDHLDSAFVARNQPRALWYVRGQIHGRPIFLVDNGSEHSSFIDFLTVSKLSGVVEADYGTIELMGSVVRVMTRLPDKKHVWDINRQNKEIEETQRIVNEMLDEVHLRRCRYEDLSKSTNGAGQESYQLSKT